MNPGSERLPALDAVRALAMLLGIFLHAAIPYTFSGFPWPVIDSSRSLPLTLLIFVIHTFRMPAFFIVAGFFGHLLHQRLGTAGFLRHRARRILRPLIASWLLLYPLIRLAWVWGGLRVIPASFGHTFSSLASLAFAPANLLRDLGFSHLWFLYYLLLVYGLVLASRALLITLDTSGVVRSRIDAHLRAIAGSTEVIVLAFPTTILLLPMTSWGIDAPDATVLPLVRCVLVYTAFFVFGWLLHRQPELLARYGARWSRYLGAAVALLVPLFGLLYLVRGGVRDVSFALRFAYFFAYACATWTMALALLGTCIRFFVRASSNVRYLADASYWMYLLHLPIVLIAALLLADLRFPWAVKLVVIHVVVLPLLLASYHLLVRFTWIGEVLNGRRLPRA